MELEFQLATEFNESLINIFKKHIQSEYLAARLEKCVIYRDVDKNQKFVIVIDCLTRSIADYFYQCRYHLLDIVLLYNMGERLIIKMRGVIFGSASPRVEKQGADLMKMNNIIVPVAEKVEGYTYDDLFLEIATSPFPAFVTEFPDNWYPGMPVECVVANPKVTRFSGLAATSWSLKDVTVLYDLHRFEKQYNILTTEFENRSNKDIPWVLVENVEYRSYTLDQARKTLSRDQECEYLSDFKIAYLSDLQKKVRVCFSKDRRPI
jgi:hypothetical protein